MKPTRILATLLVAIACALPAIAQSSDETAKHFHVFPQIADGDGWKSFLLVTNVSWSASQCTFSLYGMEVDRFADTSGITASGSTATFDLEERGDYLVWGSKNELTVATGYATLDCSAPVVAQVLYALIGQSGETAGMATVFSSQAAAVFQFPVLAQGTLAFAIANDADADASCDFVLEDPDRMNLWEGTHPVPSKSKVAKFLSEVITIPADFTGGSATVSCDQQVFIIGLQIDGTIFTTLPPAMLSTTPVSTTTPAGLAPADQAAFDGLAVGKQIVIDVRQIGSLPVHSGAPVIRLFFIAPGRIREIEDETLVTGNYQYRRTGLNTGTLTYTSDSFFNNPALFTVEVEMAFTSATAGTAEFTRTVAGLSLFQQSGNFEFVSGGD